MKVAINGFGRIGRVLLRLCLENNIEVIAVNDLSSIENSAYLFKHDSVYGAYKGRVAPLGKSLIIEGKRISYISESDPEKLPWKKLGIDVVIESTGRFTKKEDAKKHLKAGAKKVLITAPAENPDITIVPGVNDNLLNAKQIIISVASCTTNSIAPVIRILQDNFKIDKGFLTTVHAYTNDQTIQDTFHKGLRRGRAGAHNLIPTTTGAAKTVCEVIPELKGKLNGWAIRAPVICGSISDLVIEFDKKITKDKINAVLKKASQGKMKGIIEYSEEELVSSDIIGNSHSGVVDGLSTIVIDNMAKILVWYDNEYGYSNRVIDVIKMLKKWVK